MNRKLIFLDIDGTLLPPGDMLIPDSTLQALRAARANGHKLFLCTGRNLRMTAPLLEYGCFDGAICSAGGYVLCDGQVLVDLPMEPEQCSGLSAVLEQHGVDYTLESRDDTFAGPKMTLEVYRRRAGQAAEQRSSPLAQGHAGRHEPDPAEPVRRPADLQDRVHC